MDCYKGNSQLKRSTKKSGGGAGGELELFPYLDCGDIYTTFTPLTFTEFIKIPRTVH